MPTPAPLLPIRPARPGRIYAATVVFLVACGVLIVIVSFVYLIPALEATKGAEPGERKALSATAWLILSVILTLLFLMMLLVFRMGRFFLPRSRERTNPTEYVDAWAESAKRMDVADDGGPEEPRR